MKNQTELMGVRFERCPICNGDVRLELKQYPQRDTHYLIIMCEDCGVNMRLGSYDVYRTDRVNIRRNKDLRVGILKWNNRHIGEKSIEDYLVNDGSDSNKEPEIEELEIGNCPNCGNYQKTGLDKDWCPVDENNRREGFWKLQILCRNCGHKEYLGIKSKNIISSDNIVVLNDDEMMKKVAKWN